MIENLNEPGNPFTKYFINNNNNNIMPSDIESIIKNYTINDIDSTIKKLKTFYDKLLSIEIYNSTTIPLATPKQCHITDVKFGEWFYPYIWINIFKYCNLKVGDVVSNAYKYEYELVDSVRIFKEDLYILNYRNDTNTIYICYEEDAKDIDVLFSLIHAARVAHSIRQFELWG